MQNTNLIPEKNNNEFSSRINKVVQYLLKLKFKKKEKNFKLAVPVGVAGVASVTAGGCGDLRWRCRLGSCSGRLLHPNS
jgi:hypothetical protein